MIDGYFRDRLQVAYDEGLRSCRLVGQTIMLMAQELVYQSCPMDGSDYETVGKIINLPKDDGFAFMIAIGNGIKEAWPRPGLLALKEVVINTYFE